MGTEPQHPDRYVAVAGEVALLREGNLVRAVVEDARFVDRKGRIIDVKRRTCANVVVGWYAG